MKQKQLSRRHLLKTVGISVTSPMVVTSSLFGEEPKGIDKQEKTIPSIDKVKNALLAMQRLSWEQGIAMQAFLEQGDMDTVVLLAKGAIHRQLEDGRPAKLDNWEVSVDPINNTEGLIKAVEYTNDPELKAGLDQLMQWIKIKAPRNENGILYFAVGHPEYWTEGMYMLHPSLAAAGLYKESIVSLNTYWDVLYDSKKKLMHHIWDEEKKEYRRSMYWGVGNGWTVTGLARMYDLLPDEFNVAKKDIVSKAHLLIDSILSYLTPENLLHDIIDDPSTFVETNCPQMLAYVIYRGILSGWLNHSYLPYAEKISKAVAAKIDVYGIVHDVCGIPKFDRPFVAPEGQAFCIMLDAVRKKFYGNSLPQ
jgi:rhamnogalacturonyl hydrolase YesR